MATQESSGKQLIPERPSVKIESSAGRPVARKCTKPEQQQGKGALTSVPQGTVLLRHPLPKYSFQVKDQRKGKVGEIKYSQPVANVSPSVRDSRTTDQGNDTRVVTTEKSLRQSDSRGLQFIGVNSARYGEEEGDNNLSLQEALESLALSSVGENSAERKVTAKDNKEIKRLQKENEELKHQLETQVSSLKKQLDVQLQINSELKRLLVASVGDDLHFTMEHLARDKAQLAKELGDFSKKLTEDYEHMDKISIQADMWRSKFLASRVMIDELAGARAFYTMKFQESQYVLQQMLNERHELRRNLFQTHRCLQQVRSAFDPLNNELIVSSGSSNAIDLARMNHRLSENIKFRLLPSSATSQLAVSLDISMQDRLTLAESQAQELLARNAETEDYGQVSHLSTAAIAERFHPNTKFDNLTFNCCEKCKGELSAV